MDGPHDRCSWKPHSYSRAHPGDKILQKRNER